ncbi:hypothetical protein [Cohnella sp. WQ 127256]|uniref:hypothetical protein n=1 Tax=Cohnella sp. WQ 127256 TaxID=2938790 RepID=UPI0021187D8B|nr:hypothetical protein [Cohnella sp. WQ 127256]
MVPPSFRTGIIHRNGTHCKVTVATVLFSLFALKGTTFEQKTPGRLVAILYPVEPLSAGLAAVPLSDG